MTNRELKSKAMALGNRLAPRMDRRAAAVMVGVQNGRGLYCLGYLPAEYAMAAPSLKASGLRVLGGEIRGERLTLAV